MGEKKKISGEHILICREGVSTALVLSLVRLHGSMVDGAIKIIIRMMTLMDSDAFKSVAISCFSL